MAFTLGEIAKHLKADLHGDKEFPIENVATLGTARKGDISFLANRRYVKQLATTKATAVILKREDLELNRVSSLVVDDPHLGFARIVRLFYPNTVPDAGIHTKAECSQSATIHPTASVGPNTVIGDDTILNQNVSIGSGCVLGNKVIVDEGTRIMANTVICDGVRIGKNTIVHPGVVIGSDGFGLANDHGIWLKIPQIGTVIIGDEVEIGTNSSIDRGALEDTVIEDGVKIDNQVQIGHNVSIGAHTAIAGCVGIAGSTKIGKRCMIGGAVGISGHIEIADDVTITAMSGVANSIKEPGIYSSGIPVNDARAWRKSVASLKHLYKLNTRINRLEKCITTGKKNKD